MITFEEVKNQSTAEYFKGNQFSIDAFEKKYTLHKKETYIQAVKRVCDFIASAEKTEELKQYWSNRWFDEIYNDWWHPAGSIMQGAGSGKKISLANCSTVSLGTGQDDEEWDNLESIIKNAAYTIAKMAAYRQGLGIDCSRLRPVGTKVLNSSNESQGSLHWIKFFDSIGYYVGQKGRIPAMLVSLSVQHPDVIEFIKAKSDTTKIQNANISVQITDDFYKKVKNDETWEMVFEVPEVKKGQKVYVDAHSSDLDTKYDKEKKKWYYIAKKDRPYEKITRTAKAKEILELIAKGMCQYAEPGIQNIDIAKKFSNSDYVYDPEDVYCSKIISSNACSEQYLSRDSECILSSINAGKFSPDPIEYEKEIEIIGESVNRFLDNVNEMELREATYATPYQKLSIEKLRRTGAGYTNLAGWLFKHNVEYGSDEGNKLIEKFTERYNYHLYKSSINLGKEKGNFGLFDREKFEKSPFVKRMMKLGLEFHHMRNCTCSSVAPTGSLSLMFRDTVFSYGIEPAFGLYYWKRTRMSGKYEYYFVVPSIVRELFASKGLNIPMESDTIKDTFNGKYGKPIAEFIDKHLKELNINFKQATEISPFQKLDLMARVMKWIDSSISVTYMLPETANWKDVYNFILLAHEKGVKSIAAFPDKKMYGIVSHMSFKDLAIKLRKEDVGIHPQNFTTEEIGELDTELNIRTSTQGSINEIQADALKRPKVLPCDVHHVKITKRLDKIRTFEYLVIIGLVDGNKPYEVFAMENGKLDKKYTKGEVVKINKGRYDLVLPDGTKIENITQNTTEHEDAVTRLVSTSLRHHVPEHFVLEQLEKVEGDLFCFAKSIARALKKYIQNGTKVSGQTCPECGKTELERLEGCVSCTCGWSKCV